MSDPGDEPWSGLCISDSLPFDFRADPAPPTAGDLATLDATNFQTLVVDASLGESRRGLDATDLDVNRLSDLERLESKVDVVLGMLARLAAQGRPAGEPCQVRLFARGIEWRAAGIVPAAGTAGAVRLQVNPAFAQQLTLPGVVAGVNPAPDGPWVRLRFEGVGERVVEMLERLIFRRHRREVAGTHGPAATAD